jgi:long-chain acyl-CoA synthetase
MMELLTMVFHITTRSAWEDAQRQGAYRAASLGSEGFIHFSFREQVAGSAERYFKGQRNLVLLCIDASRLNAPMKIENGFPHLYAPLRVDAVIKVLPFDAQADGTFKLPQESESMNTLVELLETSAEKFGNKRFAIDSTTGREYSFSKLKNAAESIAGAIRGTFKITPRSHVALLMPNCLELLPAYFGILRADCVAVPVNARLKADELQFILGDSEAQAMFVHPGTWKPAQEALKALNWTRPIIAVGFDQPPEGTIPFDSLLTNNEACPAPNALEGRDTTAAIIYTSGTTGRPKGAMLTHGNVLFNVESTIAGHGLRGDDIHLLVVPLFHVTGLNTIMPTALTQGGKLVVSAAIDPEELADDIERHKCTTFFGVPTTFYLLANVKDLDVAKMKSLRLICYSGAPMSPLTIQRLRDLFPEVELHNFYGLTETTSVTTVLPDDQAIRRAESIGLPPPNLELCILDEQDKPLPAGEVGELCVRGASVFKSYFKRDEATQEAKRGGWFHTGDTAYIDNEGFVFLRGRRKEMFIVAGENVYPIEVENALCAHPAVQEAAVFGRPDPALGEVAHAAVVLRPGQTLTERELKAFANQRLAAFKLPRTIKFMDKLPRNPSGKVLKRDL